MVHFNESFGRAGTGIPQEIIDTVFNTYRKFYCKSEVEKEAFRVQHKDDVGYKIISRNLDGSIIQEYFNYGLVVPEDVANGSSPDPYFLSELGQCFFNLTGGPESTEMENRCVVTLCVCLCALPFDELTVLMKMAKRSPGCCCVEVFYNCVLQ